MKLKIYFVGFDRDQPVSSEETKKQIKDVKKLKCFLEDDGKKLSWDYFDNPDNPDSIFQSIIRDRIERFDKRSKMTDRPRFCVLSCEKKKAVRLEYYEGDEELKLKHDYRSASLKDEDLPDFMELLFLKVSQKLPGLI